MLCKKCGGLLIPKKKGDKTVFVCRVCGAVSSQKVEFKMSEKGKKENKLLMGGEKIETLPKTKAECPKCKNKTAYWWVVQTRGIDEAPTRFYRCTKCGHTWREYE